MTAGSAHQHIKRPTFSAGSDEGQTLRYAAARGWGVQAMCCDCHTSTRRTSEELLERFWRSADLTLADIFHRTRCATCASVRLILTVYQSDWFDTGHKQAAFIAMREAKVAARLLELAYENIDKRARSTPSADHRRA